MKFINYLNETNEEQFYKDCSNFINNYYKKDYKLWRGTLNKINEVEKFIPKIDRKPRDTPLEIHNWLDKEFQKKFGWKVRSEGVFATSKIIDTEEYGDAYLFFPSNGFKFVYNLNIEDLTYKIIQIFERFYLKPIEIFSFKNSFQTNKIFKEIFNNNLNIFEKEIFDKYINFNLNIGILTGVEISFKCNSYYLVNPDNFRV